MLCSSGVARVTLPAAELAAYTPAYLLGMVGHHPLLEHVLIRAVSCTPDGHDRVVAVGPAGVDAHAVQSAEVPAGHQHIPELHASVKEVIAACRQQAGQHVGR